MIVNFLQIYHLFLDHMPFEYEHHFERLLAAYDKPEMAHTSSPPPGRLNEGEQRVKEEIEQSMVPSHVQPVEEKLQVAIQEAQESQAIEASAADMLETAATKYVMMIIINDDDC